VVFAEGGVGKPVADHGGVTPPTTLESVKQVSGARTRFDCWSVIGYAADTSGNAEEAANGA